VGVIAEVNDPGGRRVVLDEDGWHDIVQQHGEMRSHQSAILATARAPDHRRPDPRPGRERYYGRDLGPSHWLFAVIDFNEVPARIVTAYGHRKDPPGWTGT
jgi:hypothetical protein